ncbi:hypothetical protein A2115_00965 [Candidatus Woesebacteria bacterium GWA1_41_8]|uniref:Uncharacterized protein n=1 Tax=Candidatus Woesebacteria bacterium GWA1_41_8 TaxID=1802471 RepID=A0A1F7WHP7_9BACT|nr:MAG: hypothetical protein A2115_00965 [Candidatus Woesebacteria bacterium GWA1_41_8]
MSKLAKKDMKNVSQVLMGGAVVAVVLSAIGYLGVDIWLASTQWLLIAAVLALFGVYTKLN